MKQSKALLKIENEPLKTEIEILLEERFNHQINFEWNKNIAQITVFDCDSFVYVLKQAILMMISDYGIAISCFVVPNFHPVFYSYLSLIHNDVMTAFEIFLQNYNHEKVKKDMQSLLQNIKKEYLETANVFLNCNMNASQASKELYLHRNSFNYRLNQFMEKSNMDIRDLDTAFFLKLIFASYLF